LPLLVTSAMSNVPLSASSARLKANMYNFIILRCDLYSMALMFWCYIIVAQQFKDAVHII
jgi:hypothetical protein